MNQLQDLTNQSCYQRCSSLLSQIKTRKEDRCLLSPLPTIQNITLANKRCLFKETTLVKTDRLQSYINWPHCTLSRELMASNGWFYSKVDDRTLCIYCDSICHDWKSTDDPYEVHARLAPACPFVLSISKPLSKDSPALIDRAITTQFAVRHKNMSAVAHRQETFNNPAWTQTSPSVDDLALAGFFYTGTGNSVTCFYCNGSLHRWGEKDNPKIEHARFFPNCQYAKHLCGDRLHADIQIKKKKLTTEKTQINEETLVRLVNARLDLPIVQHLRTKYQLGVIKQCIEKQFKMHEDDFKSDNDLAMACFILQKQIDVIQGNPENIITPSESQIQVDSAEISTKKLDECIVCLTDERQLACMPCGHLCTCVSCGYALQTCPICRQKIQSFVRIYC